MKKILASFCLLAISGAMAGASTYAWFSENTKVNANGMKVQATSSAALVISKTAKVDALTSVSFSDTTTTIMPSTKSTDGFTTYTTGLYYLDGATVDAGTGVAAEGATKKDAVNPTETGANQYYVDYVVYIAASGKAMPNQDLVVSFDQTTIDMLYLSTGNYFAQRNTNRAFSIDFYVEEEIEEADKQISPATSGTTPTRVGTLNLATAGKFESSNWVSNSVTLLSGKEIPANDDEDGVIRVTMRVYCDGDLKCNDEYLKADFKDTAANITGKYASANSYYTYNSSTGGFDAVGTNVEGNFDTYYQKVSDTVKGTLCYVYNDTIDVDGIEFGFVFEAKAHA